MNAERQPDPKALGLPEAIELLLFDLDGVITRTATVHAAAWKEMFDAYLQSEHPDQPPFDSDRDYAKYVDGLPRYDGVRTFLQSRGITLEEGAVDDAPDVLTVHGLGNRKNELVEQLIRRDGVETFDDTIAYIDAADREGMPMGVVSSSANCRAILESCGLIERFVVIMDGVVARERAIKGKPAPDTYIAAAADRGVEPAGAAVFEDALAGVEAGRKGDFDFVVGVDRVGQAADLQRHGADVVVSDMRELMQ